MWRGVVWRLCDEVWGGMMRCSVGRCEEVWAGVIRCVVGTCDEMRCGEV